VTVSSCYSCVLHISVQTEM